MFNLPRAPRTVIGAALCMITGLALTLGIPAPALSAGKARSSLTITASPTSVLAGESVVVRGTLRRGRKAYARQRVVLEVRAVGTATWKRSSTARASGKGKLQARSPALQVSSQVRWRFSGNRTTRPATSRPVTVTIAQVPTVSEGIIVESWTPSTAPDARLSVVGTTTAAHVDHVLNLEALQPGTGTWATALSVRVGPDGRFAFTDAPSPFYGLVAFRIRDVSSDTGYSVDVGTVEVFQYVGSSGATWLDEENILTTTVRHVNGVPYTYTWANNDAKETWSVWAAKTVGWATVLAGKVGVEDGTGAPGDVKTFRVTVWNDDGTTNVTDLGPLRVGDTPVPFRVDISRATKFEIRLPASAGSATGFYTHLGVLYATGP